MVKDGQVFVGNQSGFALDFQTGQPVYETSWPKSGGGTISTPAPSPRRPSRTVECL